jgi:signal transduction histidine kinase
MQSIARWMAEGDFAQRVPIAGTDEIAELGRTLNLMAERLSEKIQDLEGERAKVAAILDSMVEGVIAIDQRGRILLMNHAARGISTSAGSRSKAVHCWRLSGIKLSSTWWEDRSPLRMRHAAAKSS